MSVEPVQATIAGREVEGTIVDTLPEADFGDGPRNVCIVDVDGSRYRVPEENIDR